MSRQLSALLVLALAAPAAAEEDAGAPPMPTEEVVAAPVAPSLAAAVAPDRGEPDEPDEPDGAALPDQSLGAAIGIAAGGRVTAGGLRLTGHYLYQLSAQDWFDGTASFTFGGGAAACYRDRADATICDHDLADGGALEITAAVRRYFPARGIFRPFARAGVGAAIVRFGDDDVTGLAIPLHAGGGLRAYVGEGVAIVAGADLAVGAGVFGRGLGLEPQFGFAVTVGAELPVP